MAKKVVRRALKRELQAYNYDPLRDGITQSALLTWMECRERFRLQTVLGWATLARAGDAMTWGSIAHDCLERYYRDGLLDMEKDVFPAWRERANYTMLSAEGIESWEQMEEELVRVIPAYVEYWKHTDSTMEWVELEGTFEFPIEVECLRGKVKVPLRGRRDGLYKIGRKLWLFETKTKSRIDEGAIADTLERNFQLHLYCWITQQQRGQAPVGCTYNLIRRPSLRLKQKETIAQFGDRLSEHIESDDGHYFKRMEYALDPSVLGRFERDLKTIVQDFLNWFYGTDEEDGERQATLLFGQPCDGKFGPCPLLELCAHGKEELYRKRSQPFEEL